MTGGYRDGKSKSAMRSFPWKNAQTFFSFLSKRKMIQNIATHSLTHSLTLIKSLQQVAKKMFYRQFGQTQYTMPLTIFLVV